MKKGRKRRTPILAAVCLAGMTALIITACKSEGELDSHLIISEEKQERVVNVFGPMEKSNPNADNVARTAFDVTVTMAEERLGVRVDYRTYTAENYGSNSKKKPVL